MDKSGKVWEAWEDLGCLGGLELSRKFGMSGGSGKSRNSGEVWEVHGSLGKSGKSKEV